MAKQVNVQSTHQCMTRRITIAVANWLCGTLEGFAGNGTDAGDGTDRMLAAAIDRWLQQQKVNGATLYTGHLVCSSCGETWEGLLSTAETSNERCPKCNTVYAVSVLEPKGNQSIEPDNRDALEKVRDDADEIILRLGLIKNTRNCTR